MERMKFYNCAGCSGKNFEKVYQSGIYSSRTTVVVCRDCGLLCLNPRWTEKDYVEYYRTQYYSKYMGISASSDKPLDTESDRALHIYETVKKYISQDEPVLEVGAGEGTNVVTLHTKGFQKVTCIECDQACCSRIAQQFPAISVKNCSLSEMAINEEFRGNFHFIILSHVAEHFVAPELAFREISTLLAHNGYLLVLVPNIFAELRPYKYFTTPHTHYYSDTTLNLIMTGAGFKIINSIAYRPGEICVVAKKEYKTGFIVPDQNEYLRVLKFLKENRHWKDILNIYFRRSVERILPEELFLYIKEKKRHFS